VPRRCSKSMVLNGSLLAILLTASAAFSFTNTAKKPVAKHPARKPQAAKTVATQSQAQPPARRLRPAELPPAAPQVTYGDRELTIVAENSTLADVLNAVRRATRSVIDVPAAASRERVFVRIGPAAPSAVLTKLLEGSNYDYLILSANDDPGSVQRVVLTTRRSEGAANPVAASVAPTQTPPRDDDAAPEEPAQVESAPEEQNNVPDSGAQEGQQPEPPTQAEPQAPPNNGVKTPEQLLEELRRMQQQQQQQNQTPTNEN
jgi:hypothetical protein